MRMVPPNSNVSLAISASYCPRRKESKFLQFESKREKTILKRERLEINFKERNFQESHLMFFLDARFNIGHQLERSQRIYTLSSQMNESHRVCQLDGLDSCLPPPRVYRGPVDEKQASIFFCTGMPNFLLYLEFRNGDSEIHLHK